MIRLNKGMRKEIAKLTFGELSLEPTLQALVKSGFFCADGAYLLADLRSIVKSAKRQDFPDKTGYECFINSIHVEDYVNANLVQQGILFVDSILGEWRRAQISPVLNAIVSMWDTSSVVVKFHVLRPGEPWLDDQLETYSEAILVVDSREQEIISKAVFRETK